MQRSVDFVAEQDVLESRERRVVDVQLADGFDLAFFRLTPDTRDDPPEVIIGTELQPGVSGTASAHRDHQAAAEQAPPPSHQEVGRAVGSGEIAHRPAAVALFTASAGTQIGEYRAHCSLARALLPGDRARALTDVHTARDGLRDHGTHEAKQLAEVERWLAEHA